MSHVVTGVNDILGTGLTTSTNGDPNSLTLKQPYPAGRTMFPNLPPYNPTAAWVTQGKPCLFPKARPDGRGLTPIHLHFVPSGGAAITYTVVIWFFNAITGTWARPASTPSVDYTGESRNYIENPGADAIYVQISALSAGTLSVYFNGQAAYTGFEPVAGQAMGPLGQTYAYGAYGMGD